jgi:hypothetical protein
VVCTITNTRKTGKLEVVKDVEGNADGDTFNLEVAGVVKKENAGDGGLDDRDDLRHGIYTVSEAPGTARPARPRDYQKKIVCLNGQTEVAKTTPGRTSRR